MKYSFLTGALFFVAIFSADAQLGKLKGKLENAVNKAASGNKNETGSSNPASSSGSSQPVEKPRPWVDPVPTEIDRPSAVAVDSKNNIYLSDREGFAVIRSTGETLRISNTSPGIIVITKDDEVLITSGSTFRKLVQNDQGQYRTEHYAGDVNYNGWADGDLFSAKFNSISAVALANNGDIYVVDQAWMMFRQEDQHTSMVKEPGVPAKFNDNSYWSCIRKISKGKVTTLKNPEGKTYLLMNVAGMILDEQENIVYNGGGFSRAVKKIDLNTGKWSTVAGKPYKRETCPVYVVGDTSKAELFSPGIMLRDPKGGFIYADARNHRITRVLNGKVSTVAGNNQIQECGANMGGRAVEGYKDGKALTALFNFPKQMAFDSKGNLYIIDSKNSVLRKLSTDGVVSTVTKFDLSKADLPNYK